MYWLPGRARVAPPRPTIESGSAVWSIAEVVGTIKTPFRRNYDRSEIIADGVEHANGVSLGLVGVVVLFLSVVHFGDAGEITLVAVYAGGLLATLGLSAA